MPASSIWDLIRGLEG